VERARGGCGPSASTALRGTAATQHERVLRYDLYPDHLKRDHATVQVLAATVRDLHAREVPTIVVLAPINLQALQTTGNYQRRDVAGAVALVAEVVTTSGGIVIDLTTALPRESYFTDAYTHFGADGNRIVAIEMLGKLDRIH
jgi:hypothetical protein